VARIKESLSRGFLEATDIADYLVKKGESFRKSYNIVGKIVKNCVDNNISFGDLTIEELKNYSSYFSSDIYEMVKIESCISNRKVDCGTSKKNVLEKIESGKKIVNKLYSKQKRLFEQIPELNFLFNLHKTI
jgi:argininosuccinate lyase